MPVVRVVVPGLEGPATAADGGYVPGERSALVGRAGMTGGGTVVFLGPSLAVPDAWRILPTATYLGPAGQGDVYRAARDMSRA